MIKPALNPLTPEQLEVVSTDSNEFVVLASAGSGKTHVLTHRYLRLVTEQAIAPDEILTITFTRKAAAEMKERIVRALRDAERPKDAQIAETGPIQTIHSFCERLLRENILECGLDPDFEILSTSRAAKLTLDSVRDAITAAPNEHPVAERLIRDFTGQTSFFSVGQPYRELESRINSVLDALRSSGHRIDQIRERYGSIEAVHDFWEASVIDRIEHEGVRQALQTMTGGSLSSRISAAAKQSGHRVPKYLIPSVDSRGEHDAAEHTCGLVMLACAAWERLEARMHDQQALDFTMLESMAVELLQSSAVTRARLARQFKAIMVDEVQDVNPVQFELLNALQIQSRMYVGDVKQSIYAFRHADVERFRMQAQGLPTLRLTRNFRSNEGILRFVDDIFDKLIAEDYERMTGGSVVDLDAEDPFAATREYSDVEFWMADRSSPRLVAEYVGQLIGEGVQASTIAVLVQSNANAMMYAGELNRLDIGTRIIGGSEKFYTRLEVRELSNMLRAVAEPHDDFSLLATLRGDMVGLSLDAIVTLAKSKPVIETLNSFVPPIPADNEKLATFLKWYRPLREIGDRLSAWEVLSAVLANSRYLETLGRKPQAEQQIANVRKLLALAAEEPALGPLEYAERIRETIELQHREGDAPTASDDEPLVTLLTIHKAKGLEFDVVVVPDTFMKILRNSENLIVDARTGQIAINSKTSIFGALNASRQARDMAEAMRKLYVALTRARKRLCICIYPPSTQDTFSNRIAAIIGSSPNGIRVRKQKEDARTST